MELKLIYRSVESYKCHKPSTEVSKSTSPLVTVIDIALENRRVVNSKAHLVAFKSLMSIKCVFR